MTLSGFVPLGVGRRRLFSRSVGAVQGSEEGHLLFELLKARLKLTTIHLQVLNPPMWFAFASRGKPPTQSTEDHGSPDTTDSPQ